LMTTAFEISSFACLSCYAHLILEMQVPAIRE
jgi:hypothetical protein